MQFNNVWIFCIGFIDFMLKGKSLLDYTNFFLKLYYVICVKYRKFKNPKI